MQLDKKENGVSGVRWRTSVRATAGSRWASGRASERTQRARESVRRAAEAAKVLIEVAVLSVSLAGCGE